MNTKNVKKIICEERGINPLIKLKVDKNNTKKIYTKISFFTYHKYYYNELKTLSKNGNNQDIILGSLIRTNMNFDKHLTIESFRYSIGYPYIDLAINVSGILSILRDDAFIKASSKAIKGEKRLEQFYCKTSGINIVKILRDGCRYFESFVNDKISKGEMYETEELLQLIRYISRNEDIPNMTLFFVDPYLSDDDSLNRL